MKNPTPPVSPTANCFRGAIAIEQPADVDVNEIIVRPIE